MDLDRPERNSRVPLSLSRANLGSYWGRGEPGRERRIMKRRMEYTHMGGEATKS
jgi:hypothetical protein